VALYARRQDQGHVRTHVLSVCSQSLKSHPVVVALPDMPEGTLTAPNQCRSTKTHFGYPLELSALERDVLLRIQHGTNIQAGFDLGKLPGNRCYSRKIRQRLTLGRTGDIRAGVFLFHEDMSYKASRRRSELEQAVDGASTRRSTLKQYSVNGLRSGAPVNWRLWSPNYSPNYIRR
jgi:hypothetical protein